MNHQKVTPESEKNTGKIKKKYMSLKYCKLQTQYFLLAIAFFNLFYMSSNEITTYEL
jgi:hypothetical protein